MTLEAQETVTLPTGIPMDLKTSADGTALYVLLSAWGGTEYYGQDRLVIFDTATFSITNILSFGNSGGFTRIAAHPDGEKAYVTVRGSNGKVYVFDVISPTLASEVSNIEKGVVGLAITPDGSRAYVANRYTTNLTVIETVSDTVTTTIDLPIGSSGSATSVAITPDGKKAYVSYSTYEQGSGYIAQYRAVVVDVDPASPNYHATSVITTTGAQLVQFDIISKGAYAIVTSKDTDELLFVDTATDTEIQRVYTGDGPIYPAGVPDQGLAYVANADGTVVRIAKAKFKIFLPLVLRQ
jgi:DNA-binding beta-propeller fold protein YncE